MVVKFLKSVFLKTRSYLGDRVRKIFSKSIDENTLEELEHLLYSADLGSSMSQEIVSDIQKNFKKNPKVDPDEILKHIKSRVKSHLSEYSSQLELKTPLTVILIVGVNGNGKTTSTAKLANYYKKSGKKVLLAAADTFRAAAVDQIEMWSKKIGVDLIKAQLGSDPAAVAFDSITAALSRKADVLIIDTAGRLQTKTHLMQELEKVKRVLQKQCPDAPHETLLTIDATIGQNAIEQAKVFHEHTPLTGLILTKLDGSSRGGVVVPIQKEIQIPIKFVGVGEKVDDLKIFDPNAFVDELFS
ncbi:MAG: Signal recognition particle receptor FtsY [Chlamydiae bacterium]|nr:Signal recognition particle receptor FtsY [Chlamydiota bacterium]